MMYSRMTREQRDAHLARRREGRYNHIREVWGHYPDVRELYPLLGLLPNHHLPEAGLPVTDVRGVWFRCDPATGGGRRGPHRVRYLCVPCDTWVPFGRSMQHKCRCHMPEDGGDLARTINKEYTL